MRLLIGAVLAAITTTFLLFVMQQLIHSDQVLIEDGKIRKIADVQMGKTEIESRVAERKPEKPEEPEQPPPQVEQPQLQELDVNLQAVNLTPSLKAEMNFARGPGLNASDGEYLPMVKVQPQYPRRALSRGLEGFCIVEYTVTRTGSVRDPQVIECSSSLFEKASIDAALKFKYKPRVENGEAVEVPGVRNKFTYKLAK